MIYTVTLNPALDKTVEIPSFAVGTVNRITALRVDPGGKGINVSKVIAKLGGESEILAILGGGTGQAIARAVEALGLRADLTFVPGETRTNLKVVDPVGHTNTDINEPGLEVSAEQLDALLARVTDKIRVGDLDVLSGSLPKGAPPDTYAGWIAACRAAGARVFLDADGEPLRAGLKAAPYLAKPNNDELSRLAGRPLETLEELAAAAAALLKDGLEQVVVSLGSKGALFVSRGRVLYAEGLKVPVGSTVGAGDSVVAALAYALDRGLPMEETVRLSMATGAANVMCSGSQAAERADILPLMERVHFRPL